MKRTWTIIGVRDVPTSFKWYQSLFGQPADVAEPFRLWSAPRLRMEPCCSAFTSGARTSIPP